MLPLTNLMKRVAFLCCIVISFQSSAGGGWTQKKGEGFFYLYQRVLRGNKFFANDKSIVNIATTGVYFTSLYGEYGITNRLTAVGTVPLFVRVTKNAVDYSSGLYIEGDHVNSFGDLDLGLKYGLIQNKPVVLSVSLLAGVPSGNPSGGTSEILQTGDGEFNQQLRFDVSGGLSNGMYVSSYAGLNNRTKGFSDEFHYGLEVGYAKNKLLLMLKSSGVESFFNGDTEIIQSGIFSNNIEYLSIGLEAGYYLDEAKKLGVLGGVNGAFFARNLLAVPSIHLGVFYQKRK